MKPLESLLQIFLELHPDDAARAFETLDMPDAVKLFRKMPTDVALPLLQRLSPHVSQPILEGLEPARVAELLTGLPPRAGAVVLQGFAAERKAEVLGSLQGKQAAALRELASYPSDTAGGIMDPRVASFAIDLTVKEAVAQIRRTPRESLHYLYVIDRAGVLIGVLTIRALMLALPRDPIKPLVITNVVSVPATMDREEVVNLMRERGFFALPVVDFEGRLIGVVKHEEAIEAGQLEAFEDMQMSVGVAADERALSPVSTVIRSRLPWLYVNLLTAFLAAGVVGMFEGIISKIAALAVLLPVVAGQGGNTGSQSLAIVMRGLALREIIPGVKKRVVMKELMGGVINGVLVATGAAAGVLAWRFLAGDSFVQCAALAAVILLAMIINMGAAALSGAVIPLALKAVGRDPAQSASIFLTTVTDIVGFASFLGLAVLFAKLLAPDAF